MSILVDEEFPIGYNPNDIRSRFIGLFISAFMIGRYRMHRIREDRLREKIAQILLHTRDRLRKKCVLCR
jgi:hypothetical protein